VTEVLLLQLFPPLLFLIVLKLKTLLLKLFQEKHAIFLKNKEMILGHLIIIHALNQLLTSEAIHEVIG
jgi:hypothetical protein